MGTIAARKRKDGTLAYTAAIVRKKGGVFVWREAKTFGRQAEAKAWLRFRENEIDQAGALENLKQPSATLADAIERYITESRRTLGRTKGQVLRTIKGMPISAMDCADIRSEHLVAFAHELSVGRKPQTVGNYIAHLSSIFRIARPAWGMKLDETAMSDAQTVLRKFETIQKSAKRFRRPTLTELDLLLSHFQAAWIKRPWTNPMHRVVVFALFSTRRLDEITRITWDDLDISRGRVLVRDMKHPGQKAGNDVWCELPPEALGVIQAMPRQCSAIFPFKAESVGSSFTRACQQLDVVDLHFHDLRHEGISRLFEMGRTIPQAASVSGHKSWQSLQRYAHIREDGDKYIDWPWTARAAQRTTNETR